MSRTHSVFSFSGGEHRLLRFAGETPLQALDTKVLTTAEAKEQIKDLKKPGEEAKSNAKLRGIGAAGDLQDLQDKKLMPALLKQFEHLTTVGGKTPEEAKDLINAALNAAGIKVTQLKMKGANQVEAAGPATTVAENSMAYLQKEVPGLDAFFNENKAFIAVIIQKIDLNPDFLTELKAVVDGYNKLDGNQKKALYALLAGKELPKGTKPEDKQKATDVFNLFSGPQMKDAMDTFKAQMEALAKGEVLQDAEEVRASLRDAQKAYKAAKDKGNDAEALYIREKTLGSLQLKGIDVSDEDALMTNPDAELKMFVAKEKWEAGLQKFMGLMRTIGAVMGKLKGVKDAAKGGAKTETGTASPETKDPFIKVDKADYGKGPPAVDGKWQVVITSANVNQKEIDKIIEKHGGKAEPDPKRPKLNIASNLTLDQVNKIEADAKKLAPDKAPVGPVASTEKPEKLADDTNKAYAKVETALTTDPNNIKSDETMKDIKAALAAIAIERTAPGLPLIRSDELNDKENALNSLIKYKDVHECFQMNVKVAKALADAKAATPRVPADIQKAANDCLTWNRRELAILKGKDATGKNDLVDIPLTRIFTPGWTKANRIAAIEAAIPNYQADMDDPDREANAAKKRAEAIDKKKSDGVDFIRNTPILNTWVKETDVDAKATGATTTEPLKQFAIKSGGASNDLRFAFIGDKWYIRSNDDEDFQALDANDIADWRKDNKRVKIVIAKLKECNDRPLP
jgi:hypothetical protein